VSRTAKGAFVVAIVGAGIAAALAGPQAQTNPTRSWRRETGNAPAQRVVLLGDKITPSFVGPPLEALLAPQANLSTIVVNYDAAFNASPQARAAFQAAVNIWQTQVQSNVTIIVNAQWANLNAINPNILGQAAPSDYFANFSGAPQFNTWYPVALANKRAGFDLDPGVEDIHAQFNSGFSSWYFGLDGHPPNGQVDFVSVVLHELGHGLGFIGSMNGANAGDGNWGFGSPFPFIYDRFAIDGATFNPLLNLPNHSAALASELTGGNVFFGGPNTFAVSGGPPARLYAPATWQSGSSYSHLDEATYGVGNANSLMTPIINFGEAIHDPGPITMAMFADMGWTSPCTYALSATSVTFPESGTNGSVNVTAPSGCGWNADSNAGWLIISGSHNGSGNGTVTFQATPNVAAPNFTTATRIGTLLIASQLFTVTQTGCSFSVSPDSMTFTSQAATGSVNILTPPACPWTVANLPAWASTISGASGTGSGPWQFSVTADAGATRYQSVAAAGRSFALTQLASSVKTMRAGTRGQVDVADSSDVQTASFDAVAGRSYCVSVARRRDALDRASPTLTIVDPTLAPVAGGVPGAVRACFVATATQAVLVQLTQSDATPRSHVVNIVETTIWANWFFVVGNYSSFTLLRNTTASPVHATVVWRSDTGTIVGTQNITLAGGGVYFVDARTTTAGASAGSVEIGHDGEPDALVGSQTTLAATSGLSFDTLMLRRLAGSR
jgi:hypothetical protein